MPKMVKELTQGQTFSRSSEDGGVSDAAQRVFKVLLTSPSETFFPQDVCGVYVGNVHPLNANLICFDFNAKFDGDSRLVALVTFNYKNFSTVAQSQGKEPQQNKTPEIRWATWSMDSSLQETPAYSWRPWVTSADDTGKWLTPLNPVSDRYEGVTLMQPSVTFRIEQLTVSDPTIGLTYTGYINKKEIKFGSLTCAPHTILFRGMTVSDHQESFGGGVWKGFKAVYELSWRRNVIQLPIDFADRNGTQTLVEFGWDRAQVIEGNRILNAGKDLAQTDVRALNLKHINYQVYLDPGTGAVNYADNTQNQVVRAMVTIPSMDGGGWVQRPASSPVAMNLDGTPRNLQTAVSGKYLAPLVNRYQTQMDADLVAVLQLRLPG